MRCREGRPGRAGRRTSRSARLDQTRAPRGPRSAAWAAVTYRPSGELPDPDRETLDGVRVVRRPDPHVSVAAVRADHGDEPHDPDQHLVVVQVGNRVTNSPTARSNVSSETPWNRSGWMFSIWSTRSADVVGPSLHARECGGRRGAVGEFEVATGVSADVQAAVAKTSQTVMTGRYRRRRRVKFG